MVVITNSGCTSGCDVNCEYHCRSFGVDKKLPVDSAAFQYKQIKIIQLILNMSRVAKMSREGLKKNPSGPISIF